MIEAEELFAEIGKKLTGEEQSQMFGKPCFKINKKAFICFFENDMVFKLTGDSHNEALSLDGSKLFDPSGKNRPMKEWVQVPFHYHKNWKSYAEAAL
ncbi:MAG: hypothetical protein AB8B72_05055 [Crocinitomicaceae bacterium]